MGSGLTIMQRWWSSPQSCPHVTGTNPVRSSISLELANGQVLQTRLRRRTMQKHRRAKALTIFLLVDVWIQLSQLQGFTKTAN